MAVSTYFLISGGTACCWRSIGGSCGSILLSSYGDGESPHLGLVGRVGGARASDEDDVAAPTPRRQGG
jgi:hypothetical protein